MDEVKIVYDFLMLENTTTYEKMNKHNEGCKYIDDLVPKFLGNNINGFISHGKYGIVLSSEYEKKKSVVKLMTDPQNTFISVQNEFYIGKTFNSIGIGPEMYNYGYKIIEDSIILHFISMSMVDFEYTLKSYFQEEDRTENEINSVLEKVFDILEVLRDNNLVHGDLHLSNIVLFNNKEVTLVDFGMSTKCKTFYVVDAIRFIRANHLRVSNPNRDIIDRIAREKTKHIFDVSFPEFTTIGTDEVDFDTVHYMREEEDNYKKLMMN